MRPEPMWRRYLRFWGPDIKADVDAELEAHLAMRASDLEHQGVDPAAARQRARAEFGDLAGARRECRQIDQASLSRGRRVERLATVLDDLRYAVRLLGRAPGFALVAILTLALGIGANTAIFSLIHGVLLQPLPYDDPGRLVRVYEVSPRGNDRNVVSDGNFLDWRNRSTTFTALGAHRFPYGVALTGEGTPRQVQVVDLTPSLMELLGVPPRRGRSLGPGDAAGDGLVAVLSDRFWRTQFGADPTVIGRTILLDDRGYRVVGVMPAAFDFPDASVDLWRPFTTQDLDPTSRRSHNLGVVGRLGAGVSREQAQADLSGIAHALAREYPQYMADWGVNVTPLQADLVSAVRPLLLVLLGGVALVLVIACANLANLLLGRMVAREREIAVRGALGAGRGRLVRQLLTESAVLAAFGGLVGIVVARVTLAGLLAMAPPDIPRLDTVHLDLAALGFAAGATVVSTLLFGALPALRLARTDLQASLRTARDAGGPAGTRLRSALLAAEVALSMVLLAGAGLVLRSFDQLRHVDYGFEPAGMMAVFLDLPRARYAGLPAQQAFYRDLISRFEQLPGVERAAATSEPPGGGYGMTFSFAIEGRPSTNPSGREDPENLRVVSTEYFRTTGIPVLRGRGFDSRDRPDAPTVVVINQALAHLHWPGTDPVGGRISFDGANGPWMEIVGVVGDTRIVGADQPPSPAIYLPFDQKPWEWLSWSTILVRVGSGRSPESLAGALRAAVWDQDPELPIHRMETVPDLYREGNARRRFAMMLLAAFASVAVMLGTLGIYGVLSYTVAQRRQEIGVRIALGAGERRVVSVLLGQVLTFSLLGIGAGLVITLATTRFLRSLLYQVSPTDPLTLAGVIGLLLATALGAAFLPARRATRISPVEAMRGE